MAGVSVSGVGSGLDLASLLKQLIAAEKQAPTARFDADQAATRTKLSSIGSLKGAVAGLKDATAPLKALGAFSRNTAISADPELFTASADSSAVAGHYEIEVKSLANAAKLASGPIATSATPVGTGTLTISVGAMSMSLTIAAPNNSLAAIRDAINGASSNPGVRASIITADDGAHLVLTGQETGTDHAITVTRSGGDGGLDQLVYNPGVLENLTVKQAATDASVVVDGFEYTSHSNQVTGPIGGVTISLKGAEVGTKKDLEVARDVEAVKTALKDFVTAYNKLVTTVTSVTAYNASTHTAAPLSGDALPRSMSQQIRSLLGKAIEDAPDAFDALSDIGFTTGTDGQLKLDETALTKALDENYTAVQAMFAGDDGFATGLDEVLASYAGSAGIVASREASLNAHLDRIADQREALARRLDAMETRLRSQFAALDSLVSKMNSTGSYLTQQLANLNKATSS